MQRTLIGSLAVVVLASGTASMQAPDASAVLAATRQALGGEARLNGVSSFSVSGSLTRRLDGRDVKFDVEIVCVLPDKFVRSVLQYNGLGIVSSDEGFNGEEPILGTTGPTIAPLVSRTGPPRTPEEMAAARRLSTLPGKHLFAELTVPLFAASFAGHPLTFTSAEEGAGQTGSTVAIDVKGANGFTHRLWVDASSHLPVKLTWMAPPRIVLSAPSVAVTMRGQLAVTPGGSGPVPTPGALVEYQMAIGDYKREDGLNWPHRLTTTVAGEKQEELRLGKFKINPKIDLKKFAARGADSR